MPLEPKDATPATAAANRDAAARYDLASRQDFTDADRGFIAGFPDQKLRHADGTPMFDLAQFDYLTVSGPKAALVGVLLQPASASRLAQAGQLKLDGDEAMLTAYAGLLDDFDPNFPIVTP